MKVLSLLCLTILQYHPVHLYNTNRLRDTCHYYENPNLIPIFDNRFASPNAYFHEREKANGRSHHHGYFLGQDEEPSSAELRRKFNIGYLNVAEPIKNIGDLVELNSEEIGMPEPPPVQDPSKLWKLDEVKTLSAPEVLPDVVLHQTQSNDDQVIPHGGMQVLDEHEIKLGRKLLENPPFIPDMMPAEKSLVQEVEDMGDREIEEEYLREQPIYEAPSVVVDKVIQIEDKDSDFMGELQKIKQGNIKTEDNRDLESPIHEVSQVSTTPKPATENTIEKESNAGNLFNFIETAPTTDGEEKKIKKQDKKKKKSKNSDNKADTNKGNMSVPQISSRTPETKETILDGLLSVL